MCIWNTNFIELNIMYIAPCYVLSKRNLICREMGRNFTLKAKTSSHMRCKWSSPTAICCRYTTIYGNTYNFLFSNPNDTLLRLLSIWYITIYRFTICNYKSNPKYVRVSLFISIGYLCEILMFNRKGCCCIIPKYFD